MLDIKKYMAKEILHLVWPVILDLSWFMIVNIVVTTMVGSLGSVNLAAVSLSNMIQASINIIFAAAGTGAAAIVAREEGAGNYKAVRVVTGQALLLGAILGLVLALGSYIAIPHLFKVMGVNTAIASLSVELLRITFVFTPLYLIMSISNAVFRSLKKPILAFYVNFISNTANLVVSYMLIYGHGLPCMGPYGAAWGIRMYQLIGGIFALLILMSKTGMGLNWRDILRVNISAIRHILSISLPASMEQLATQGGRIVYTFMLTKVGTEQFAAHQIALQVESVSYLPGFGYSVAAMTLVAQHLGKGMIYRAGQYAKLTNWIGIFSMTIMGIIFFLFSRPLTELFIQEPNVVYWGSLCVMIAALEQPTLAITYVLGGALRGAGDTKWPLYITTIGVWFVRIPIVYFLICVFNYDITVAWLITAGDFFIRSILFWHRFSTSLLIKKQIHD